MNSSETAKRVVGRPFKPGVSGNPNGRPKDVLANALREKMTEETAAALSDTLYRMALGGDLRAIEVVLDRTLGKAIARQEQGSPGEFDALSALRDLSSDELRAMIRLADNGDSQPSIVRQESVNNAPDRGARRSA